MTWIRRNPFTNVDPTQFMIEVAAKEAEGEHEPLRDEERTLLGAECTPELQISGDAEKRLRRLVEAVVKREQASPEPDYSVHTFLNAIEWVEPPLPYVFALAEAVLRNTEVERFTTTEHSIKGLVKLGILIVVIGVIIVVIKLVNK
jgi:hypothetical protein